MEQTYYQEMIAAQNALSSANKRIEELTKSVNKLTVEVKKSEAVVLFLRGTLESLNDFL